MNTSKSIPTLILFLLSASIAFSQSLIVTLNNSNTETFETDNILSLKFGNTTLILTEKDGTVNTWEIDDIDNYRFDEATSISENSTIITEEAHVFPNPASSEVNIRLTSSHGGKVTIDILDISGKLVEHVYSGDHNDGAPYIWYTKNAVKGTYLCRIITDNKVISKPVIIR